MEVYEIRSFAVLAEQLHFGRAAQSLHLTQPALTKQIQKIESELGGKLFERGRQGARLTSLGESWLPRARDLLDRFDQLVEDGKSGAAGRVGRLRIGFGFHSLDLVPRLVVELRGRSPDLEIMLRDMSSREQALALKERDLDIGFLRMPADLGPDFEEKEVLADRLLLVGRGNDHGERLTLEDCRAEPFVMISQARSPGFYGHTMRLCATRGFHPKVVQEVTEFTTALALARAGMGVTVIPESIGKNKFAGTKGYLIEDPEAAWLVSAVWRRKDQNPVLLKFLQQLEVFRRKDRG